MAANRAGLARISRIDKNYRDTLEPSFVFDKPFQLVKSPLSKNLALSLANRPATVESLEVFKGHGPLCLRGQRDNLFRDDVIRMSFESSLFSRIFFKMAFGRLRAAALKLALEVRRPLTNTINFITRKKLAVGGGGNISNPEIDAERSLWGERSSIGNFDTDTEKERILIKDEISLPPYHPAMKLSVFPIDDGNLEPPIKAEDADLIKAKGQDARIIDQGGMFTESSRLPFVEPIGFNDFADCPYRKLCAKAEFFPHLKIAEPMQINLPEAPFLPGNFRDKIAGLIKALHRLYERGLLLLGGKKLHLHGQFHGFMLTPNSQYVKEGAFLPGLKTGVSAPESLLKG